jgi:hypothetical protein
LRLSAQYRRHDRDLHDAGAVVMHPPAGRT